jgi:hypothetical protein
VRPLVPMRPADVGDVTAFLTIADLTLSGLDDPGLRIWLLRATVTHQVRLFRATGQLADEVAWSRAL